MRRNRLVLVLIPFAALFGCFGSPLARLDAQEESYAYVPPGAVVAVTARPQEIIDHEVLGMLPVEVAEVWADEQLGLNLRAVQQIRVVVNAPIPTNPGEPVVGAVVTLSEPYDPSRISSEFLLDPQPREISGKKVWIVGNNLRKYGVCSIDDHTVVIADPTMFRLMLGSPEGRGPLVELMKANPMPDDAAFQLISSLDPVRPMFEPLLISVKDKLPPQLEGLDTLPALLNGLMVNATLTESQPRFDTNILAKSPEDALRAKDIIDRSLAFARELMLVQVQQSIQGQGRMVDAQRAYAVRLVDRLFASLAMEPQEHRLNLPVGAELNVGSMGVMVGLLLPAVQAAREASRRMAASNGLRQIGLAMHNYEQANGHLPSAAIYDDDGEALLSWRVALLPYLGYQELYDQFHLDEPWDSDHNGQLIEKMPSVYLDGSYPILPGYTVFHAIAGEGYVFSEEDERRFRDVTDGLSNTVAVMEAGRADAVPWTSPELIDFEAEEASDHFGDIHVGVFQVLFLDGSVRALPTAIDNESFEAMMTIDGGEEVRLP